MKYAIGIVIIGILGYAIFVNVKSLIKTIKEKREKKKNACVQIDTSEDTEKKD